ncbi:alpha-tocopherol transfer protein-like isoform X1 [Condylostylus longicornis]|uniref:alpha-tocopherol transfer protein-like isoform X1 n=1 Tax=Condylostylus longicornis TaxID=2530218 RepID=UPI00244E4EA3|nr:alpha-tocopherol transfer protein-like isoform X1 [Condylostylus longicornis]
MKLFPIEEEFKKNPDLNPDELKKLMEWINQQPHLPEIADLEASLFLHSCYYSIELAKQTIDTFVTMRTHVPEFFHRLDLSSDEMKLAMNNSTIFPIEKSTPEGYKIYIGRLANFDARNFNFASGIKLFSMIFDLTLREGGSAPGHIIILDLTGVSLGHVARLGPLTMKKFLYFLQDAAPIRIVGFHFINIVPFSDKILALMRPFMKKELSEILHFHENMESLKKFIPLEILPKEYGGLEGNGNELCGNYNNFNLFFLFLNIQLTKYRAIFYIILENIYKHCIENQDFFTELETRKVNEKARPGKPKDASVLFGIEGNFKKLDID